MHDLLARFGSPLYVYDLDVVRLRARALRAAITWPRFQPLFAIKANPNPAVARAIVAEGFGIDAVSPGEVALALRLGVPPSLFSILSAKARIGQRNWRGNGDRD